MHTGHGSAGPLRDQSHARSHAKCALLGALPERREGRESMRRTLKLAWAAPWSIVGLSLAPFFESRRGARRALVCEGAGWAGRLGWRYRAITFGHVILSVDRLDEATLDHELVHVAQYEKWGPLFVPLYLLASLRALLGGGHFYRGNAFEVAAHRPRAGDGGRLPEDTAR